MSAAMNALDRARELDKLKHEVLKQGTEEALDKVRDALAELKQLVSEQLKMQGEIRRKLPSR
jgi:hypothetical protein